VPQFLRTKVRGRAIPRTFGSHRSDEGRSFRRYVVALLDRLPGLPRTADALLGMAGALFADIEATQRELDTARQRGRAQEARRLRRGLLPARSQLLTLEAKLEAMARERTPSTTDALAAFMNAGVPPAEE
jgi:hypothetical protein